MIYDVLNDKHTAEENLYVLNLCIWAKIRCHLPKKVEKSQIATLSIHILETEIWFSVRVVHALLFSHLPPTRYSHTQYIWSVFLVTILPMIICLWGSTHQVIGESLFKNALIPTIPFYKLVIFIPILQMRILRLIKFVMCLMLYC